jgi:hypothetical protein
MRSTTVVFRGISQVVEAYEANDVAAWAIVNGETILCADNPTSVAEGKKMLEETLQRLNRGNSRAAFDLKVYKIKPGEDIMPRTQEYRGFRFSLYEDSEMTPFEHGRKTATEMYDARFAEMQKEIKELKDALAEAEESEVKEKPGSAMGMISGILELPNVKQALSMKLVGLIDKIVPLNIAARPAAVAGVPTGEASLLDADQQQKVQQAVYILCSKDAKLGDHLLAIANIAATDIKQYNKLTAML